MKVFQSGPAALIGALYDDLHIGEAIDSLVTKDPEKANMSPGLRIKAIIVNIFCGRKPLYREGTGF